MTRKKLIIVAIGVLVVAGLAYKMVLAPKSESKVKVEGTVYVMPKEFLLNLADGRYAKVTVALVLAPGQSTGGADAAAPPEAFGTLGQQALVRFAIRLEARLVLFDVLIGSETELSDGDLADTEHLRNLGVAVLEDLMQKEYGALRRVEAL